MSKHQKITGRASSVPAGLASGAAVSVMTTGGLTVLMAMLLEQESITWEMAGYGILIMIMLSAFLGALTACTRIRRQRLLVSVMSGGLYFAILLSVTALFFGGQYQAVGVTALLIAGGCTCSVLLTGRQGKRRTMFKL